MAKTDNNFDIRGDAAYVYLNSVDTGFGGSRYKIEFIRPEGDPEFEALAARIQEYTLDNLNKAERAAAKAKPIYRKDGNIHVRISSKYLPKEVRLRNGDLVRDITADDAPRVGFGSTLRVKGYFMVDRTGGNANVVLRWNAVMIIEARTNSGGFNEDDFEKDPGESRGGETHETSREREVAQARNSDIDDGL